MEALTKDEYKNLLNEVGTVARFYIEQIEGIKSNLDFMETFESINKYKGVTIEDIDNWCFTSCRFITRDNETIYLIKNTKSFYSEYEDTIIYYLTVDFNKKIKMYIDYNMIERNEPNNSEIYFEILEYYDHRECGDVYGNGRIIGNEEEGYKGCISTKKDECIMEYGKYEHTDLKVIFPDEKYEFGGPIPELKDLNTENISYRLTKGVNNPVFLAHNEMQELKRRERQRIR